MSLTSPQSFQEVQAELLTPAELEAALARRPTVYLPLGSLEFHGPHLPIGLDGLTAHGVCLHTAAMGGGVVLPPVYQAVGGEHAGYPWTFMMPDPIGISLHLRQTLMRLETFGARSAILFTGHFAGEQMDMIDGIADEWNSQDGHLLAVLATGVNRCPDSPVAPDHAGVFETSLLHALYPELVHLDRLPAVTENPEVDDGANPMGRRRHDPASALWGIFGPDPRGLDLSTTGLVLESLVRWLGELTLHHLRSQAEDYGGTSDL